MSLSGDEHPTRREELRETLFGAPHGRPSHPWRWILGGALALLLVAGGMGAHEVSQRRAERWRAENRAALESSNAYVEANGLPLARYRGF